MAEYEHGKMDITQNERTFEGFLRVGTIGVAIVAVVLIFLALVGA